MRNRAGLTWIVVWILLAQLLLTGPTPAFASSGSTTEPSPAMELADLRVLPVEAFGSVSVPAASFSTWVPSPDAAELRQLAQTALDTQSPGRAEGPETYTDELGFYRFVGLPQGTHKVTIDAQTLPAYLQPAADEAPPVLWVTPGMEQTSEALSTGVRFTVVYDRESGDLSGYVFWDQDGDGQMGDGEPGLAGVRVIDPTVHQYFVPFDDNHLWELFVNKAQCHSPDHTPCAPMVSNVFLAAGSDGTVYFYDHWEDGYDEDPVNPQAGSSTIVGVLDAGATQTFPSDIIPANIGTTLYYDGRDRITVRGEDANVIRLVNAAGYDKGDGAGCQRDSRSGWLAAAWEVPEVAEWGTEYHTIVGEDLALGAGGVIQDHNFVGIEVMAWQDNTVLTYNGDDPVMLNAGETFFVPGENGGAAGDGVKSNSLVITDKPVQAQMMTGSCNDEEKIVSAHGYTLIPRSAWGRAYWAPVPGFDDTEYCRASDDWPAENPNIDTDIYIHNPSFDTSIVVTVQSGAMVETISVGPHQTNSVLAATGWSDLAFDTQGTYLFSDQDFWGLVVVDSATRGTSGSDNFDWGYSLLPESELSSQVVIGYGPGRPLDDDTLTQNANMAFVVAVEATTIYVDLNQDGLPDPFDMDGDSELDTLDAWGVEAWDEPISALGVPVEAGQVLRVADPFDDQLRGARIYTADLDEHIAVAWGQDPCAAFYLRYLDLGYTVLSSPVPRLNKDASLAIDADSTDDISPGDIVTYTLVMDNNGRSNMNEVWLTDTLPYTHSVFVRDSLAISYLPPTSVVEYLDGGLWGTTPITGAQAFRVYWPVILADQVVTLTFRARINEDTDAAELVNGAEVDSDNTDPVFAEARTPVVRPVLAISKWVDRATVSRGEPFTYTIIVSNTDTHTGAAVGTRLWDQLPPGVSYVPGTLDLQWPEEVIWYESIPVSQTTFFHGVYADDFDRAPSETTGYSGSDGSLDWDSDWLEVGESDGFDAGSLQVRVNEADALSVPAFVWMGTLDGAEAGLSRRLDLSQFVSPTLRFHRAGLPLIAGEYYVTVDGVFVPGSRESYDGAYGFREFALPTADGIVTLGLMVDGMTSGDEYRFDHISVYERQSAREGTAMLSQRFSRLEPRVAVDIDPISYDPSSREMVITDSLRLPAQGVMTVTLTAMLDPSVEITETLYLTNTAYVRAENRPQTLQDTAVVSVTATTADVAITKSDDPDPVLTSVDRTLTYTLVYTNYGPVDAENVVVTDTLPDEVTYNGMVSVPAGWGGPTVILGPPVQLVWTKPTVAVGESAAFVLTTTVDQGFTGVFTNHVEITTDTPESRYDNNQDDEPTEVDPITDVMITKVGDPDVVGTGDELVYTLVYTNNGPHTARNVVVSDTLIPEIEFVEASPAPVPPTDTVLTWELGTLAPGESGTIVMTTTVTAAATETFTNTVEISTTTPETDYDNNSDDDPTDVGANVAIVKSGEPNLVAPGDQLVYTLVYRNEGPAAAHNVVVSDTVIPEFEFVEASLAPSLPTDTVLTWELGTLASGESGTIVVTTTVTAEATATFTNTVQISTDTLETRYDDNWDDDPTDVALADVAIIKVVSHRVAAPGESLIYTLTYENLGNVPAQDVVVWDDLPDEILFDQAVPMPHDRDANPLRWDLGTLDVGESGTILVYADVRDDLEEGALVQNVARIQTSTPETDYSNNQDAAPTPVSLIEFAVTPVPNATRIEWETTWEARTYGFYLYRGESDARDDAEQIAFVPAAGRGQGGGARYVYKDEGVGPETTYHYWLVVLEIGGPDGDTGIQQTDYGPARIITLPEMPFSVFLALVEVPALGGEATGGEDE